MLLKLAWRNIWRNRRRSVIVLSAIVVGIIVLVMSESLVEGVLNGMLENQVGSYAAHIQIHQKGFNDNRIIQRTVPDPARVERAMRSIPTVTAYSTRVLSYGLLSSASNSSGVSLIGVHPDQEERVSTIKRSIVEGNYLSGREREIVVGKGLSERLGVVLGDKVVAMASTPDGQVGSDVFRISGIYQTSNSEFDRVCVYISIGTAQRMLAIGDRISEFAVIASSIDSVEQIDRQLELQLDDTYEVLNYKELMPAMMMMIELFGEAIGIYYLIIGIAVIFGIINAMLMSVLERIREFGVLMAMGMKGRKLFSMIMIEALFLGIVGTVIGLGVGVAVYLPFWKYGLDLSAFAEGLTMFGMGVIVYPVLTPDAVVRMLVSIPFMSVLASIYPAMKAIRLQPVRAIYYA